MTTVFSDTRQVYIARVTAMLEAQASQPALHPQFQPIKDTHLDLPLLTVTPCGRNLCVALKPRMEHLRQHYDLFQYRLKIEGSGADRAQHMTIKSLKKDVVKDLATGRQYCISVCFWDQLIPRVSNYSRPQCVFTPGVYTADPLISGVLCLLLMSAGLVLALLVRTGFICLKQRQLPLVLTSIHHIEDVVVAAPCSPYLSSLLNLKVTAPSSGEKSSKNLSDESDEESETENTAGNRGGHYKLWVGTNLPFASSSSSSLPPSFSSNPITVCPPSDVFHPQPEAVMSAASLSDSLADSQQSPSAGGLTVERTEPEEVVVGDAGSQDVNLLTLTFGRREEKKTHLDTSEAESPPTTMILPSQTVDTEEVSIETISCTGVEEEGDEEEEEEEEAELSAYMRRPVTDVLQNLL
ncbi:hypothetical protein PAMA_003602 [Pampus argenteus]